MSVYDLYTFINRIKNFLRLTSKLITLLSTHLLETLSFSGISTLLKSLTLIIKLLHKIIIIKSLSIVFEYVSQQIIYLDESNFLFMKKDNSI